jgi:hypothetical protein
MHSSAPSFWHARVCLRQFFTMQLFCSSAIQSELCTEHHSRVRIGGQNGDAIRAVPAKERAANTVHETCFRVLILCCIATPTGQLARAGCFIACFIGCFSVCFFAWAIADCALHRLASQSGAFTACVHTCALLHSSCVVVVRFIHHALLRALSYQFWRAMQLALPIIINGSIMSHQ